MTREEIIALAVECGAVTNRSIWPPTLSKSLDFSFKQLEKFASLVAEREREARKAAQQETIALREELTKRAMQAEKDAYQRGVRDEREACIKDCMSNISPQMMAEGDWPAEAAEMVMFCVADIRKRNKC